MRWIIFIILLWAMPVRACITVKWTPPTTYTDGSALTVGGYKVYYGTASGSYPNIVDVGNVVSHSVEDVLTNGTLYYLVVTARDTSGIESAYSNEVSKVCGIHRVINIGQ